MNEDASLVVRNCSCFIGVVWTWIRRIDISLLQAILDEGITPRKPCQEVLVLDVVNGDMQVLVSA